MTAKSDHELCAKELALKSAQDSGILEPIIIDSHPNIYFKNAGKETRLTNWTIIIKSSKHLPPNAIFDGLEIIIDVNTKTKISTIRQ
ncbi:hypothetical protein LBMAG53_36970 [Planctomycetota bacterium]|nr:hypothetical protein LBMAG53_36970 [Planctomycetota bacterium]